MACSGSFDKKRRLEISRNDQPLDSSVFASSASNCFPGSRAMLNFGAANGLSQQGNSSVHSFDLEEAGYDCFNEYLTQPEKKRRLSIDQIQFLEKCFVADNRLEPERKIQLAKELNLKPRQVAIWFQNRRARWRNKQLEMDYETLNASFMSLKNEYDKLVEENEKLKSKVLLSKHVGPANEMGKSPGLYVSSADEVTYEAVTAIVYCQDQEFKELALAKSDVTDAESPQIIDGIHLFNVESGESSRFFDQSDMSQNGEDELLETFDNSSKTEDSFLEESNDSFHYGLQVEDHSLNFWPY